MVKPQNNQPAASENISDYAMLRTLAIISMATSIVAFIIAVLYTYSAGSGLDLTIIAPVFIMVCLTVASYALLLRGIHLPARLLLPISVYAAITYLITNPTGYGLHDLNILAYAMVITLSSLTLGTTGSFIFAGLIIATAFGIRYAEANGQLSETANTLSTAFSPVIITVITLGITFIQRALINQLNENFRQVRTSQQRIAEQNQELLALNTQLEQRVANRTEELARRTKDLEHLSATNQERARKLRAIAEIARSIAQVQNLDQLLPAIAVVISQEFNYYHVGIFLNDDANQYAILRAANSDGGRRMLARAHRLKIGQVGIVGNVAATGTARIASETGADAAYFNNPDLPATRSEIALPLRTGRAIIGVLDVQSDEPNAFTQSDVELLTILADQVSTAIHNSRLFAETQRALNESETISRQYVRQQWSEALHQRQLVGAKFVGYEVTSLEQPARAAPTETESVRERLTVPIKIRSEVVGIINIRAGDGSEWDADEIDIIEATAERVALAIENARLLQEAQRRASKERVIGDISTKLSSSTNIDNIIRTALQELSQVIPGSEIFVEFEQGASEMPPSPARE